MSEPYEVARLDDLDRIPVGRHGLLWRPVRRRLGIEAFGVNAYTAEEAGQEVVEHHDETGSGAGKHEELYVVVRGHARFSLDDQEIDAPAGTFVFVRDRAVKRGAHAQEPGTTVLALGGQPGEAFQVSPWEYYFAAIPAFRDKEYARGIEIVLEGLERFEPHTIARSPSGHGTTRTSTRSETTPASSQLSPGKRMPAASRRRSGTGLASGRATTRTAP